MRQLFIRIAEFYQRQADKGEFDIRFGSSATVETIRSLTPDVVVIATGSSQRRVDFSGGKKAWTVTDALTRDLNSIQKVLVVDFKGTMEALMVTDYLSDQGIAIEFITPDCRIAAAVEGMTCEEMLNRLHDRGIIFNEEENIVHWDNQGVLIRHNRFVEERTVDGIDAVIISAGANANNRLALELRGIVSEIHTIGDANTPRTVHEATLQGGIIGRLL